MNEETARATLRLIAVVVVLLGLILVTGTLLAAAGAQKSMEELQSTMEELNPDAAEDEEASGMFSQVQVYLLLAHAWIAIWGLVLYYLSPVLARRIVK